MEPGKNQLLAALADAGLVVLRTEGKYIYLEHNYLIEVEGDALFKLSEDGYIVAPFGNIAEMVRFVLMDISENN